MRRAISFLVIVFLIVGAGLSLHFFLLENPSSLQLKFLGWRTKELSTGVLILLVFLLGAIVPVILLAGPFVSRAFEIRRLKKENEALQLLVDHQKSETTESGTKPSKTS